MRLRILNGAFACTATACGVTYFKDDVKTLLPIKKLQAAEVAHSSAKSKIPPLIECEAVKSVQQYCATTFALKSAHVSPNVIQWDRNWDSREPQSLVKPEKLAKMTETERAETLEKLTPKATRHIILIRHGQYNLDTDKKDLTALGREQALLTGQRLQDMGINYERMVHSTMTRAKETGELIMQKLPESLTVQSDLMLEEGAPFPPEPSLAHWRPAAKEFLTDGSRIEAAFRKYFYRANLDQQEDSYEILTCHGNVIRYFVCRALQFPPEGWLRLSNANCSITWILIRPSGRVIVKSFGDHGHIPPAMVTFS